MTRGPELVIVAARGRNGVIGQDGALPWRLRTEMAIFRAATLGKPVIMGRKTWESLPKRPLPGRANFILSRHGEFAPPDAVVGEDFTDLLAMAREQAEDEGVAELCVIGGASLYALALPRARRLRLTEVDASPTGDTLFPTFDEAGWREVERQAHPAGQDDDHAFVHRVLERA